MFEDGGMLTSSGCVARLDKKEFKVFKNVLFLF